MVVLTLNGLNGYIFYIFFLWFLLPVSHAENGAPKKKQDTYQWNIMELEKLVSTPKSKNNIINNVK